MIRQRFFLKHGILVGFLLLITMHSLRADDTDIYLDPTIDTGSVPIVMLSMDHRPNLTSTMCNDAACDVFSGFESRYDDTGRSLYKPCITPNLNENGVEIPIVPKLDEEGNQIPILVDGKEVPVLDANGAPELDENDDPIVEVELAGEYLDVVEHYTCNKPEKFQAILKAAIRYVLYDLAFGDDPVAMKVGFMMSHNDDNKCTNGSGYTDNASVYHGKDPVLDEEGNPTYDNKGNLIFTVNKDRCSNGGFIRHRVVLIDNTAEAEDSDRDDAMANFESLYNSLPDVASGGDSHFYQGAELFFEMFRYLTGQAAYNGHVGLSDDPGLSLGPRESDYPYSPYKADKSNPVNLMKWNWDPLALCNDKVDEKYRCKTNNHLKDYVKADPSQADDMLLDIDVASTNSPLLYDSPIDEESECSEVSTINFLFNVSQNESDSNDAIAEPYNNGGLDLTLSNNQPFRDILQKLNLMDLGNNQYGEGVPNFGDDNHNINVTSHFIFNGQGANTVRDYATNGGGSMYEVTDDVQGLIDAVSSTFRQILNVSSTFVSASVPINVFNKSEFLDNVYLALFEANEEPRWEGNLKRLRLDLTEGSDTQNKVVDVNGIIAFEPDDGKIKDEALTYWTYSDSIYMNDDLYMEEDQDKGKDGKAVDKGGAGQNIPGFLSENRQSAGNPGDTGGRIIYTEPGPEPESLVRGASLRHLNATTDMARDLWSYLNTTGEISSGITPNAIPWSFISPDVVTLNYDDATSDDQDAALNILRYIRGQDVISTSGVNKTSAARRWILGDPIHSRPFPINYGALDGYSETHPDIRIIMGSNDGFIRMFDNADTSGVATGYGKELWAFMPTEMMSFQYRLMNNVAGSPPTQPIHPYGVDGTPVIFAHDINDDKTLNASDKVNVYFGLRRGGKAYYALDITDPGTPKFGWKITKTTEIGSSVPFNELGLTFSVPRVAIMKIDVNATPTDDPDDDKEALVLIFAGGYDVNKDARSAGPGTPDKEGNAIYIVNAITGELIWKATAKGGTEGYVDDDKTFYHPGMLDSIPSGVTTVESATNKKFDDRLYVGDTGGNVWRADLFGPDRSRWTINKLASFGRQDSDTDRINDRRFFHAPEVIFSKQDGKNLDYIIIGSGDRANPKDDPTDADTTENKLFVIKDVNTKAMDYSVLSETSYSSPEPITLLTDSDDNNPRFINAREASTNSCQDYDANTDADNDGVDDNTNTKCFLDGWYVNFFPTEKMLSSPLTMVGTIFATTYVPTSEIDACGPKEGNGFLYALNLLDGSVADIEFRLTNDDTDIVLSKGDDNDRFWLAKGIPSTPVQISNKPKIKILLPGGVLVSPGKSPAHGVTYWYKYRGNP